MKDFPGITGPIIGFDEKGDRLGTIHKAYVINDDGRDRTERTSSRRPSRVRRRGAEGLRLLSFAPGISVPASRPREARMELLVQNLLNGVTIGAFYSLVALGYTMVYGVLKLINFAHGDLFMWGAYLGWTGLTLLDRCCGLAASPWMLVPVIDRRDGDDRPWSACWWSASPTGPLRTAGRLPPVISALGAAFILESLARNLYGASYKTYPAGVTLTGGITIWATSPSARCRSSRWWPPSC